MTRPEEERFRPRTGRPKGKGATPRRFTSQVVRTAQTMAASPRPRFGARSTGGLNGRGRVAAAMLGDRIGPRARRVVVKARLVVRARAGPNSAAVHLRYLRRDGVSPDGARGQEYGSTTDHADGVAFIERGRGDRHQFRFIVSPEDAGDLGDLRAFTRELMSRAEADLGTRLDWIAVDHHDTDNPHTHLIVRGVDDQGRDLVIARDYITHGLRLRACSLATDLLGPQTDRELAARLDREVKAERWTSLDRQLEERAHGRIVEIGSGGDDRERRLRGRLQTLQRIGLAEEPDPGRFHLRADLEATLRAMGERGDIIRTMQRAFSGRAVPLEIVHDLQGSVIGRIVAKGLADELGERSYLVVDGLDGKGRYIALPPDADLTSYPHGGVVRVQARTAGPRPADRVIANLAEAGVYRPARHLALAQAEAGAGDDPNAFVRAHVRRLEALRRAGVVERIDADRWRLPPEFLERAAGFEAGRFGAVQVDVLTDGPPQRQARLLGATWLDRALIEGVRPAAEGFGAEVGQALQERRAYLAEQGLAERQGRSWRLAPALLATLKTREIEAVGARLAAETGLEHRPVTEGDGLRGTYRRSVNLVSGRFAMIDDGLGFSLVPWRSVMESRIGQTMDGVVRSAGVDWSFGRSLGR